VSRDPPPAKRGRRENDVNESHRRRKLEKGKESATKDADEEPFAIDLLKSTFRKLEDVGAVLTLFSVTLGLYPRQRCQKACWHFLCRY
jgi:hypothetical protein